MRRRYVRRQRKHTDFVSIQRPSQEMGCCAHFVVLQSADAPDASCVTLLQPKCWHVARAEDDTARDRNQHQIIVNEWPSVSRSESGASDYTVLQVETGRVRPKYRMRTSRVNRFDVLHYHYTFGLLLPFLTCWHGNKRPPATIRSSPHRFPCASGAFGPQN